MIPWRNLPWQQYAAPGCYDELINNGSGPRPAARALCEYLASLSDEELSERKTTAELLILLMSWTRISEAASTADLVIIRAKAIELLVRREHSRLELRQKLMQRGFPAEGIDSALNELAEEGLLNEGRYAEIYACNRADKGYGPLRIASELRERGIPQELVEQALAGLENDWLPKLMELHRKRFKSLTPADAAGRMQQTRVFRQRGFTQDQIRYLFEQDA